MTTLREQSDRERGLVINLDICVGCLDSARPAPEPGRAIALSHRRAGLEASTPHGLRATSPCALPGGGSGAASLREAKRAVDISAFNLETVA